MDFIVDPFQQYRLATFYAPRFYTLHHRWINPGIAKHAQYNTALLGSSIMENTANDVIGAACGKPAVNLSMPAMSAAEMRLLLQTVFDAHEPQNVILVLDFNAFAGRPDARQDVAGPLPVYLYDRNVFNDLPYLLSGTVLRKSISILLDRHDDSYRSDANAPWYWADRVQFGAAEVLRGLDLSNLNARFQQPERTLSGMEASFEVNVLPILRDHPHTKFYLVWPPYSLLVWKDFLQRNQLDVTFAFKRYVAAKLASLHNVYIIDLQSHREITGNLNLYKDLYHFAPSVDAWLVERACAGLDQVNLANVDLFEAAIRRQVAGWQPMATRAE